MTTDEKVITEYRLVKVVTFSRQQPSISYVVNNVKFIGNTPYLVPGDNAFPIGTTRQGVVNNFRSAVSSAFNKPVLIYDANAKKFIGEEERVPRSEIREIR